jgi:tetratricopeptide (TPR) repeat protein
MRRALGIDPRYQPAYLNLGRHLVAAGRADEAVTLLRQATAQHPADVDLLLVLGEASLATRSTEEAIRAFEAALTLRPGDTAIEARLHEARAAGENQVEPGEPRP